jgi:hypothetical protein
MSYKKRKHSISKSRDAPKKKKKKSSDLVKSTGVVESKSDQYDDDEIQFIDDNVEELRRIQRCMIYHYITLLLLLHVLKNFSD